MTNVVLKTLPGQRVSSIRAHTVVMEYALGARDGHARGIARARAHVQ